MASTHAPSEALTYAKTMVKYGRLDDTTIAYQILDEVHKVIWYAAPWSWTVKSLSNITVLPSTTDYAISIPGDFEFIYRATLVDTLFTAKDLAVVSLLPSDSIKPGEPVSIAYDTSAASIRIYPKPPAAGPLTTQQILLEYKITAPEITSSNYTTPGIQVLPDRWWHVYKAGVLARAYAYADDDRGMSIKTNPRDKSVEIGGFEGYFQYLINEMRLKEPMPFEWKTALEATADNR